MSKRNTQSLLNKIIKESSREAGYRDISNKHVHEYTVDLDDLIDQVTKQIIGSFVASKKAVRYELTQEQHSIIRRACITYFNHVKTGLKSTKTFKVSFKVATPKRFVAEISTASKNTNNIFAYIRRTVRQKPLDDLRNTLLLELQASGLGESGTLEERILGGYNPNTGVRAGGLLQLGHLEGTSVAEQRTGSYLKSLDIKIDNLIKSGQYTETHPLVRLNMAVSSNPSLSTLKSIKVDIVHVFEQSQKSNINQSAEEQYLVRQVRSAIEKSLREEDWSEFESSPSANDMVQARLEGKISKLTKKKKPKKLKKSNTKVSAELQAKTTRSASKDSIGLNATVGGRDSNIRSWSSLIPIINAKLPSTVASNMVAPRLVNRTGNFASSAKVVSIESTKQGYTSINYTYDRSPYDVFDRYLGKSPWNTPQRDPRTLVETSIKEVIKELAIGRFYLRRA